MESKNGKIIAAVFAVFIAVCIIFTSLVILSTPVEITSVSAGNYSSNLMNGGNILGSSSHIFYSIPGEKGIYRVVGETGENKTKIADSGDGYLQVVGNSYYYSDDNKLICCGWDGNGSHTALEYAKDPLVVGGSIYYLDEDNELCRYSYQKNSSTKLNIKPNGQFSFLSGRIYYIGEDNKVYNCDYDGENTKLFVDFKVEKFALDGQYMFFISNGWLYCTMGGGEENCLKITKADDFAVYGAYIIYNFDGKLYAGVLGKLANITNKVEQEEYAPYKLEDSEATYMGVTDNKFYYFDSEGALNMVFCETGEKTKFKK